MSRAKALLAAFILLAAVAGCQTGRGFRATTLPPEYRAPLVRSARNLDLSPLARGTGGSDVIQPNDLVTVATAAGLPSDDAAPQVLRVASDGTLNVPLVGPVRVAGLSPPAAEYWVRQASMERDVYRNPQVSIQFETRHANNVTVLGAVENPGVYPLNSSSSDLLAALVAAGGLSEEAGPVIEIRHPNVPPPGYGPAANNVQPATFRIDLQDLRAAATADLRLYDGTVVMVPQRVKQTVYVMGLVNRPGVFEIPPDDELRLLDGVAMAGGRRMEIADKVRVTRRAIPGDNPIIINASIREAQRNGDANIRLAAGDVVQVEETTLTFTIETLRSFIRLGVTTGLPGL
jgi:polysaccharide export outer membrane protein